MAKRNDQMLPNWLYDGLQVSPGFTVNDVQDDSMSKPILAGQRAETWLSSSPALVGRHLGSTLADLSHLIIGQLGAPAPLYTSL